MKRKGFTLVEILIVVIILGILAAIVIPQFTEASTEARESSLVSNLQTLRSQVALYSIQHGDNLPVEANFEDCLTQQTDVDGVIAAGEKYGPYMQKVPENPFITDDALPLFTFGDADPVDGAAGDGLSHWYVNRTTGSIFANDTLSTPEPDEIPHAQL